MKHGFRLGMILLLLFFLSVPSFAAQTPEYEEITYGMSGEHRSLKAYRFGSGENVLVVGFALHGYEDNWSQDGEALVRTAQALMESLRSSYLPDSYNWTVYVLPCMNPDGLYSGWTNNGPGRCTTTCINSNGDLVTGSGIDMNRCFPTGFRTQTNSRNRTTERALACVEAQALSAFIQKVKGSKTNVLLDVHGWMQQTITTSSRIKNVLQQTFPTNLYTNSNGGGGYLIRHAHALGYESCLLELPDRYSSLSAYLAGDCIDRVIRSVEGILRTEPQVCLESGHCYETQEQAATCTAAGCTQKTCSVCGHSTTTARKALGHQPQNTEILTAPTASQPGLRQYDCSRCGLEDLQEVLSPVFVDVDPQGYYAAPLDRCYAAGYIKGTSASTFSPGIPLSRAMLVTILYRLAGSPESDAGTPFTDVSSGDYFYRAVAWAYGAGIVSGTTRTTFSPNASVTREQAMTIFFRYIQHLDLDNGQRAPLRFADVDELANYAVEAAQWSVANGVISGDTHNNLMPRANTTRAQGVTILIRAADYAEQMLQLQTEPTESTPASPTEGPAAPTDTQ